MSFERIFDTFSYSLEENIQHIQHIQHISDGLTSYIQAVSTHTSVFLWAQIFQPFVLKKKPHTQQNSTRYF